MTTSIEKMIQDHERWQAKQARIRESKSEGRSSKPTKESGQKEMRRSCSKHWATMQSPSNEKWQMQTSRWNEYRAENTGGEGEGIGEFKTVQGDP